MKTRILRALSERAFVNLWSGELFTQIAGNLFNFFLILVVFQLTHSNTAVSGVVLSFTVPAIFFGSLAGALVDRWDKKKVMIISNLLRSMLLIVLAFYLNNLVIIYVISLLITILAQFFIPAESPMLPLTVSKENLLSANALFSMGIFGSILVAYVLSGPLIIVAGTVKTLFILAAAFVIGAVLISLVKVKYEKFDSVEKKFSFIKEVKSTLALILKSKKISHSLFFLSLSQIIILILATIAPGYASQVLGLKVEDFPLTFVAPAAVGMVFGAIIMVNIFHSHPKERIITGGIVLSGFALLALPFGSSIYLPYAVIAFILGVSNSLVFVPANTIIQEATTDKVRGKIYGFINTIVGALSLLPIIMVGGLSDLIGVSNVIIGIGAVILMLGIIRILKK